MTSTTPNLGNHNNNPRYSPPTQSKAMSPTVILIRHAQALHNLTQDYTIPDPPLTGDGEAQCAKLRENLIATFSKDVEKPDEIAIVVSPMRRTLQTAMLSLNWLIEQGVKIEGNADWQGSFMSIHQTVTNLTYYSGRKLG
ncbi:uncharacterized protein B0J16DRAFT_335030 [Fusarium flagelliforme]|uniref:uncharacterized protein n=1 Tax=Fusarium flagelliforme TaxID=2675880 RepID=UPI001E8E55EC|nr:uncharacterized protein B0J16DRAFT_335030 [Fusarium flagelliforme]KAH7193343.1 hypothetical protein B0J16DRAFT_335030 [Fusarium flagelliforme]